MKKKYKPKKDHPFRRKIPTTQENFNDEFYVLNFPAGKKSRLKEGGK